MPLVDRALYCDYPQCGASLIERPKDWLIQLSQPYELFRLRTAIVIVQQTAFAAVPYYDAFVVTCQQAIIVTELRHFGFPLARHNAALP
jgi:hypothetical protein